MPLCKLRGSCLVICCVVVGCTICFAIAMAIPVSMIAIGARYLNDCPVKRYIAIYLIVGGVFAFYEFLSGFVQSLSKLRDPNAERTGFSKFCRVSDMLVGCFTVAWFIAGTAWVYSTRYKFSEDPNDPTFCHPTLYWYAFWIITTGWITIGFVIVVGGILVSCALCCSGD